MPDLGQLLQPAALPGCPIPCVSVCYRGWLGYLELATTVWNSCTILALPLKTNKKKTSPRPMPAPNSPCLVEHGRQAFPCLSPLCSPRTFRPTRNMPDVQIPQVMREFITRGVWAIQEWEPDQGLDLEKSSRGWPGRAQVALSETYTGEESTGRHGVVQATGRWPTATSSSRF